MAIASKYWQFVGFDAAGRRRIEVLNTAKQFFEPWVEELEHSNANFIDSDAFIQTQLWKTAQGTDFNPTSDNLPVLSLRCCVSHLIEQSCIQLAQQFGESYHFRAQDLLPLVLDANSRMASRHSGSYESLTTKILSNFNPRQGNLGTWTIRLVRNDRRINEFLLEHGVYLISDWAILNDSTPQQVERILLEVQNLTPYEAKVGSHLLRAYHKVYRGDRIQSKKRGRCYEPTLQQLQRIVSVLRAFNLPEFNLEDGAEALILSQLQTLASQLRQYRILRRGGTPNINSIDAVDQRTGAAQQIPAEISSDEENEQELFLTQYRGQLKQSLDEAIKVVLERRYQQLQKKRKPYTEAWVKGLYLFHCCDEAMGKIAHQIGFKAQYQVSRLLQLKAMRADIRQEMLQILGERVLDSLKSMMSPQQLIELEARLEEILAEQVDELLDKAAAEASASKTCSNQSFYAQRLCHCLSQRVNP